MKFNKWTIGLAAVGVVSLASAAKADEKASPISVQTALSSTTISGYIDTAAHWNPGTAPSSSYYSFGSASENVNGSNNFKDDGFNLNVVDLTIERPMDESEWAAGYKAEMWFGPDANNLGNNSIGNNDTDFNVRNAYVALRVPVLNGIDFKMGVFDTPIGYETQVSGNNPNYTRSWGFTIEPTQHTGIIASSRLTDWLTMSFGIANTWNSQINGRVTTTDGAGNTDYSGGNQATKTFLHALTLTAPESFGVMKGATLTAGVVDGRLDGQGKGPDYTSIYVGATIPTHVDNLTAGLAWDHMNLADQSGYSTQDTDAVAGYLSFKASEKLTINGRVDYLWLGGNGQQNTAAGPAALIGPAPGAGNSWAPGDQFVTTTVTLDYALWKNVISRVEYRWDHDVQAGEHFGQGTLNNDQLLALNVIYKF